MGSAIPQAPEAQHLRAAAQHEDGQWKVLIRRGLATDDEEDLALPVGRAVPMAFQAWDGDNGERGNQGAVSTWYFLFLRQRTPRAVYVAPPVALALTLAFGVLLIRQTQRSAGAGGRSGPGESAQFEASTSTEDGGIR
jgi:hypothetical protein